MEGCKAGVGLEAQFMQVGETTSGSILRWRNGASVCLGNDSLWKKGG